MIKNKSIILIWINNITGIFLSIAIIPFLISSFGTEGYGKIALIQVACFSVLPFIDFGLSTVASAWTLKNSRLLSDDEAKRICLSLNLLFFISAAVIFLIWVIFFDKKLAELFFWIIVWTFFSAIPPFYMVAMCGLEKMYSICGLISKILLAALIFVFCRNDSDYAVYIKVVSLASLPNAIVFYEIAKKIDLLAVFYIKKKKSFFVSLFLCGGSAFLRRCAALPIGFFIPIKIENFVGSTGVGAYSICDKLRTVAWQVFGPIIALNSVKIFQVKNNEEMSYLIKNNLAKILFYSIAFSAALFSLGFLAEKLPGLSKIDDFVLYWGLSAFLLPIVIVGSALNAYVVPLFALSKIFVLMQWVISLVCIFFSSLIIANFGVFGGISIIFIYELTSILLIACFFLRKEIK